MTPARRHQGGSQGGYPAHQLGRGDQGADESGRHLQVCVQVHVEKGLHRAYARGLKEDDQGGKSDRAARGRTFVHRGLLLGVFLHLAGGHQGQYCRDE